MGRSLAITGIITAGLTAVALAAGPALAQGGYQIGGDGCPIAGSGTNSAGPGTGWGGGMMGNGYGNGSGPGSGYGGMMGNGNGRGAGMMGGLAAQGTLTSSQQATLASMAEEEKLAHDVYVTLAAKYPADYQFARISRAETMHQAAVRSLLARYGLADPTAGLGVGQFASSRFQTLFGDLTAKATSAATALEVGQQVERLDIADLTSALNGLTAPDVTQVYTNLRVASQHHLAAFGG